MSPDSAFASGAGGSSPAACQSPGLYVHVPFCSSLCPYCDFAVNVGNAARRSSYLTLLLAEVELVGSPDVPFDTLYFGGGTPSSLPPGHLAELIGCLQSRGWLADGCGIFLEANPEDASPALLGSLRDAGVGTLSLGIQSLDDDSLRFLGRRHDSAQARRAIGFSKDAGFETFSLDLMYGLPGQTEARWEEDLKAALALEPDHLSCYQLTVHEKTRFGRLSREGRFGEASEERQAELFRFTHRFLLDNGLAGYEVSNFARAPRHRSRHNQKYWSHAPYVGLGPAAHGFDGRSRAWNHRSFFDWKRALERDELPLAGRESLSDEALLLETLMLRLRTREGLDLDAVRRRFGVDLFTLNRALIQTLLDDALIVLEGAHLRPTVEGLAVADGLASAFRWGPVPCRPFQIA